MGKPGMNMHNLKIIALILCLVFISGCWDRREIKTLGIVAAIGIDQSSDGGKFLYTFQVIKPREVQHPKSDGGASESGGVGGSSVWVGQSGGQTPDEAIRNITFQNSRRLFFAHNQAVVIGMDTAKKGVMPLIDLDLRYPQIRVSEWVIIAKGKAGDILSAKSNLEVIPAFGISGLITEGKYSSKAIPVRLQDFFATLIDGSRASVAPQIEAFDVGKEKFLRLSGTAVFKKDRWVGEFNETETRGLMWIQGKVEQGVIDIAGRNGKRQAAIDISGSNSNIEAEIHHGDIFIRLHVDTQGELGNILILEDFSTPDKLHALEKLEAKAIREEILAAWKKARLLKADVFGFGDAVHQQYPRQWQSMKKDWERIFPTIHLSIKVNTVLKRVGEITSPPIPE